MRTTHPVHTTNVAVRNPFRQGQRITIPTGTPMRSTNPRKRGVFVSQRLIHVTVFSAYDGYLDMWNDASAGVGYVHLPSISYVGSGDYWHDIKITPELAQIMGGETLTLPTLHPHDHDHLDVVPCFGPGYDDRD